jgi:hypothetical protein
MLSKTVPMRMVERRLMPAGDVGKSKAEHDEKNCRNLAGTFRLWGGTVLGLRGRFLLACSITGEARVQYTAVDCWVHPGGVPSRILALACTAL